MLVLLVRHAIAEDRKQFALTGGTDAERPLTARGRRRMRRGAAGLRRLLPHASAIAGSPFVRAMETAALLARRYEVGEVLELPQLAPGAGAEGVVAWLKAQPADGVLVLVGHEPDLARTASRLLSGIDGQFIRLKKGGACLLRFRGVVEVGAAELLWCLALRHLRRLGR